MKGIFFILFLCAAFVFTACNSGNSSGTSVKGMDTMPHTRAPEAATPLPHTLATEKKDPVCGMPVTAGITDTAHYKGNVYGFCASECKKMFTENPAGYLGAN